MGPQTFAQKKDLGPPSRPLDNLCPFHEEGHRGTIVSSGYRAQVRPPLAEPCSEEMGRNGVTWSGSVVTGHPEPKACPSRIMRLFSAQRKCDGSDSSLCGPASQAWSGRPGLRGIGSFKKLRSTVFQGIQNRGNVTAQDTEGTQASTEVSNGGTISCGSQDQCKPEPTVANGISQMVDASDEDGDGDGDEIQDGFGRNSHFSRSIRRAYRAGRIPLMDAGDGLQADGTTLDPESKPPRRRPVSSVLLGTEVDLQVEENGNVLSRLSKSAENLHVFKSPFQRKAASPQTETSSTSIQRTVSISSMDGKERKSGRWKVSPLHSRAHVQRLVGSLTDLTSKHRSATPVTQAQPTPLSKLHDDYSRRTPCVPAADRQRRPPLADARATPERNDQYRRGPVTLETSPSVHPIPHSSSNQSETHTAHLPETPIESQHRPDLSLIPPSSNSQKTGNGCLGETFRSSSPQLAQRDPNQQSIQNEMEDRVKDQLTCIWNTPDGDLEDREATSYRNGPDELRPCDDPSTVPSTCSPTAAETSTSVVPRRRSGRPRPRPISDYAQLVSRKYSIPEEEGELPPEAENSNSGSTDSDGQESCPPKAPLDRRRRRPVSVLEGVELFPSPSSEEREDNDALPSPVSRPPMPSHQVPPYRAVSARLRPCVFSQSTPTGLDRLGQRKLHRVLSDGNSEGCPVLDDCVSEEDSSFDELTDITPYLQPGVELSALNELISAGHVVCAEALWDHVTMEEQELAFKAGEVIRVVEASSKDWWCGIVGDREAWFPSSFVRVRVNQEDSSGGSTESALDLEDPLPRDNRAQMRTNVVQEIMNTERVYIKHLRDICEGYIRQCRKHPNMFTDVQLKIIFSNIEEIYKFQRKFLKDLEKKYNKDNPHLSEIGSCFLQQGEGFSIYSEYCNTHPAACTELQRLMKLGRYKHFFEACRLLQQMIDISIAGFLLTPVQKICKYPLQLGELLKYTPKDHSDYQGVSDAYEAMKNVASLINERKRRLESIDTIAQWQMAILRWEGENVLERSSELIHSGELTRVLRQGKTQQRSFFLFDHQLVFCKKDVLRRDLLHYRGRLDTDNTEVQDLPDGRDAELGVCVKNGLKLRNTSTQDVCILCCRKAQDKQRWTEAFSRERRRVQEDQEMGMEISESQRKEAILNARKSKQGKMKGYLGHSVLPHHQPLHPLHQRHVTVPTSIPQQQVFSLAEPKRKTSHLWYNLTRHSLFRK
ncbi:spermatogenesis-associated protein 13 isoform X2 [Denticeps clupeoides]|nr:spermatogenesis-associated protein 13-like isoform X2 [Denticeps clupeoides]